MCNVHHIMYSFQLDQKSGLTVYSFVKHRPTYTNRQHNQINEISSKNLFWIGGFALITRSTKSAIAISYTLEVMSQVQLLIIVINIYNHKLKRGEKKNSNLEGTPPHCRSHHAEIISNKCLIRPNDTNKTSSGEIIYIIINSKYNHIFRLSNFVHIRFQCERLTHQ